MREDLLTGLGEGQHVLDCEKGQHILLGRRMILLFSLFGNYDKRHV
jgi:hypothetical protein